MLQCYIPIPNALHKSEKLKGRWHNVDLSQERIYLEGEKYGEKEENNNGEEKKSHL